VPFGRESNLLELAASPSLLLSLLLRMCTFSGAFSFALSLSHAASPTCWSWPQVFLDPRWTRESNLLDLPSNLLDLLVGPASPTCWTYTLVRSKGATHDGQDTVQTLRMILWYKRACMKQTTRPLSLAVPTSSTRRQQNMSLQNKF